MLLRNSDHALAIQRAGEFFIYDEHYDLSPLVVLSFLCNLFEAAKTVENIVEKACLMLILLMFSLAIRS